jgi:RND family efflux transporter MFP subunit
LLASTRERTREALESNAVSTQQWDEADRGFAAQEAVVRRVAAEIESVDVDIAKSSLSAPFSGVIARRFVDEGSVVAVGEPLFRLLEIGRPEIRVGISVELVKSLAIGDERVVRAHARELHATVRALLPSRNRETRTVDVVLTLPTETSHLRDGDLVEVELSQTIGKCGFWLPRSSLTESSRGLWASYVATPLGDAERRLREVDDQVTLSETNVRTRLVRLYKSLGGRWEVIERQAS